MNSGALIVGILMVFTAGVGMTSTERTGQKCDVKCNADLFFGILLLIGCFLIGVSR